MVDMIVLVSNHPVAIEFKILLFISWAVDAVQPQALEVIQHTLYIWLDRGVLAILRAQ